MQLSTNTEITNTYTDICSTDQSQILYEVCIDVDGKCEIVANNSVLESSTANGQIICVSKPIIDRISGTVQIHSDHHYRISARINELLKMEAEGKNKQKYRLENAFIQGGTRYKFNLRVVAGHGMNKQYIGLIQARPVHMNCSFFRFECNPSKIGGAGIGKLRAAIKYLLGKEASQIFSRTKLTRIDVAVDIFGLPIDAIKIFANRGGTSAVWGQFFDGSIPSKFFIKTQQVGSKTSRVFMLAYDKQHEQVSKGIESEDNRPWTRIEFRIRPTLQKAGKARHGIYLNELDQLPTPFEKINIALYSKPTEQSWMFDIFLLATQQIGAQAALAKLSRAMRLKYRQLLKQSSDDWWCPGQLMDGLMQSLKDTKLFPPKSFTADEEH